MWPSPMPGKPCCWDRKWSHLTLMATEDCHWSQVVSLGRKLQPMMWPSPCASNWQNTESSLRRSFVPACMFHPYKTLGQQSQMVQHLIAYITQNCHISQRGARKPKITPYEICCSPRCLDKLTSNINIHRGKGKPWDNHSNVVATNAEHNRCTTSRRRRRSMGTASMAMPLPEGNQLSDPHISAQ
jgi:hypothetical protein